MTHEKLVAGTTSPTRYTKIIRNPGAGTKYNRTYQETEYVSRYTKTVAGGKDYVPPAPPLEPLVVAHNQGSNWLVTNVYQVGKTVEGKTAAFTGGKEPVTYHYRFQFKATDSDSWVNDSWTTTTNAKNSVTYELTETGQVKLQSQARDSSDPVVQESSVTGSKEVIDPHTIGHITIDPAAVACAAGGKVTLHASWDGTTVGALASWKIRSGPGSIHAVTNEGKTAQVMVNSDAERGSSVHVTCAISHADASDTPQSSVATIVVES